MKLYAGQVERGAYFLHEHPAGATSWELESVRALLARDGVERIVSDQCQLGQETENGDPIKKPSKFMTNSPCIAQALRKRCNGKRGWCSRFRGGRHALCNGERAKAAAIYPFALCRAILTGFGKQMLADGRLKPGSVGLNCCMIDWGEPDLLETHLIA